MQTGSGRIQYTLKPCGSCALYIIDNNIIYNINSAYFGRE